MRSLGVAFCPVCREHTIKRIFDYYQPNLIEAHSPDNQGVYDYYTEFSVTSPEIDSISIEWLLNGAVIEGKTDWFFRSFRNESG
jgi:hypothetical protein